MKKVIAVFDFDGTLVTNDSFVAFIRFACGRWSLINGLLLSFPFIVGMKLNLLSHEYTKEKVFGIFFRGWKVEDFKQYCIEFISEITKHLRKPVLEMLSKHSKNGDTIYIVSASIENWIIPWADQYNVSVIGTKIEINAEGLLTGHFASKNCNREEKVRRLLELEPNRDNYILYAYGDSNGDKELVTFADFGMYIKEKEYRNGNNYRY